MSTTSLQGWNKMGGCNPVDRVIGSCISATMRARACFEWYVTATVHVCAYEDCGEPTFGLYPRCTTKLEIWYEGWVRAGWVEVKRTAIDHEANPLPEVCRAHSSSLSRKGLPITRVFLVLDSHEKIEVKCEMAFSRAGSEPIQIRFSTPNESLFL